MCLQKVTKKSLSPFDDNRFYENNIKNKPWNYYYWFGSSGIFSPISGCKSKGKIWED